MPGDDFKRRTFQFGIRCIRLIESLPKTMIAQTLAKQLLRSATSVGANYRAAVRGRSRAEFVAKLGIVEEECDESLHWTELLTELKLIDQERAKALVGEGNEFIAIAISSIKTARKNAKIS